ncbi:hypothetical protein HETIRDRAFT_41217 [Heterobasidion irregulare TC 32-1]|uniref:Uncharacterized protein n=1 Tax=Heterobasidion irregulare (strain TC 32-1) TaxID=747525 RepID=W4KM51_HETIT|nr:uncharacterized protein HETIRDRAFT_41217 [Heterobasidion irregulare TC 32-1]ETW86887.1 hypothetical protein HETIRDRAFT_41217 [Heterobasidion irregulare TC 32-1]
MSSDSSSSQPIDTPAFENKPTVQYAATVGLQAGLVGAFVSAVQNALGTHSKGASGFLSRSGGTIGFFAAMGSTFALTESIVANQRQKDDALNGVAGGCAAGFLAGIKSRSLPVAVASCALIGVAVGTFDYSGQSLRGDTASMSVEEKRRRFFKQPQTTPAIAED